MKKIIQRFLIFIIGIPLVIVIVYFLDYKYHLILNIIVVIFSSLGAHELRNMLKKRLLIISTAEAVIFGGLVPALMTLVVSFDLNFWIVPAFFFAAAFWILVSSIFISPSQLENYIYRVAAGFSTLIYPGAFLAWICAMGRWDGRHILVFLLVPMLSDAAAWAAGMLFGKNNSGIFIVSPNKSIAGFIGGLFASVLICVTAIMVFPGFFIPRFGAAAAAGAVVLGLVSGLASELGDLCESAIKRSTGVKDSGALMPGRGGVLDSIDSIALAAPAFYFTWMLFFTCA